MTVAEWQASVHKLARDKGWYDQVPTTDRDRTNEVLAHLAKIHGEVSEAQEVARELPAEELKKHWFVGRVVAPTDSPPKPEGFGIELADVVIRIMDTCGYLGIDLQKCMEIKHEYNRTRPIRHGGKKA